MGSGNCSSQIVSESASADVVRLIAHNLNTSKEETHDESEVAGAGDFALEIGWGGE